MLIKDAVEDYQFSLLKKSSKYQIWVLDKLRVFASWCETNTLDLADLRSKHYDTFLNHLSTAPSARTGKPLSSYTVHGYAQVVKVFLTWAAGREDYEHAITERRTRGMELPKVDERIIEPFSDAEISALLDACKSERYPGLRRRNRMIVLLLGDTGIRLDELLKLKASDIHLDPHDSYIKVFGKGRKERTVPLGLRASREMVPYLRTHQRQWGREEVFLTRSGTPVGYRGVEMMIEILGERAGLTGVRCSPHTFRHTFAVNYMKKNHDIYSLSKLLGHTTVAVTERYLKAFRDVDVRGASASAPSYMDEL